MKSTTRKAWWALEVAAAYLINKIGEFFTMVGKR